MTNERKTEMSNNIKVELNFEPEMEDNLVPFSSLKHFEEFWVGGDKFVKVPPFNKADNLIYNAYCLANSTYQFECSDDWMVSRKEEGKRQFKFVSWNSLEKGRYFKFHTSKAVYLKIDDTRYMRLSDKEYREYTFTWNYIFDVNVIPLIKK